MPRTQQTGDEILDASVEYKDLSTDCKELIIDASRVMDYIMSGEDYHIPVNRQSNVISLIKVGGDIVLEGTLGII